MGNLVNNKARKRSGIAAALFFFLLTQISFALPADTVKNKYDINDPRNPNCPCHKHQQQAENEYRQLQGNLINASNFRNDDNNGNQTGDSEGSGFGVEKISISIGKISFYHLRRTRNESQESAVIKKK